MGLSRKNKWDKCPKYGSLGLLFKETFLPICSQRQVSVRKREERKKKKGRERKEEREERRRKERKERRKEGEEEKRKKNRKTPR